jgi:hypothetical protein
MSLVLVRLVLDFGVLVLIWMTQLVVYPGFKFYSREGLLEWHKKYTSQITYIVLPLMLGQLVISGIQLWNVQSLYTLGSFLIIVLLWASTFLQFIPLHNKIAAGNFNTETGMQLVKKNWLRTVLWTALFGMSLVVITFH